MKELDVKQIREELVLLMDEAKYREFREQTEEILPADIAEIMYDIDKKYCAKFFRLLAKDTAADVFVELDSEIQESIISSFTDKELSAMLDELYIDDTVDIIEEMPANAVKRILRASSAENRSTINQLLRYPKDSAGSIMTTEYVRFTKEMAVGKAIEHIREVAIDKETIYTCYVTDKNKRLLGIVSAKDLLISKPDTRLEEIMEANPIYVETGDKREEVAYKFDKYGFLALPVVDAEMRLVGIVTLDDAIGVLSEEVEEDFAKMAGIAPSETPYLKTSFFSIFKARFPWLLFLMLSATLSSAVLRGFEGALPAVFLLFTPMIMGTGGNSGGQSSVTVTRAISVGELSFSSLPRVLLKELSVGALTGSLLGVCSFLKLMLIDNLLLKNSAVSLSVALAVSLTILATVITAKLIGAALPLLAKKIGLDPAVMASPVITTLVDALSLLVYFAVASSVIF